jgi:ATPase subunit of ABC transporter with duplicated ATPase domains
MAGRLTPDSGTVDAAPPAATVGLLDQELNPGSNSTVRDLIADRLGIAAAEAELEAATAALAEDRSGSSGPDPATAYERALERYLALGAADLDARLDQVAKELGLARALLDRRPETLSGGEAERVGLAIVILSRFDLTLLDEPTNNLDLDGLARLERWVAEHRGGLVVVSHDRAFLERTVETVIELDHHHHTARRFEGGWVAFLDERARDRAQAQERYEGYVNERDRLAERAQRQREWAAKGASRARRSPADGDKFRRNYQLAQTEKLVGKAKATKRAIDRLEVVDKPWEQWELRYTIDRAERSADVVCRFEQAVLERGRFELGPVDLEIRWADRVGVIGPNGSGKSTLIDGLLGRLTPLSGTVRLGSGVVAGELDQSRHRFDRLDGDGQPVPLVRAFQDLTQLATDEVRSLLAKFGLDAEAVGRPAHSLSPGERTRAQLALFQAVGVNLLVLDEPTNHLDLPAIEQLESALNRFDGTLVLVTHDRRLQENVALTRTVDLGSGGLSRTR